MFPQIPNILDALKFGFYIGVVTAAAITVFLLIGIVAATLWSFINGACRALLGLAKKK